MRHVIREKRIYCGSDYLEVDIYPYTIQEIRKKRSKKKKVSLLKQSNLNDKNARRKFIQIAEANFKKNDYAVHLTYNDENLPNTIEEAERDVRNFIRRIKRKREKAGLKENLKYMVVTSGGHETRNGEKTRIHHHLLINNGLTRDEIEALWRKKKAKGEKDGKSLGHANVDRIQPSYNTGITDLASYLSRQPVNKRRWSCSQNLQRPVYVTNDVKYSRRELRKIATEQLDISYWEKRYKGYTIKDKLSGINIEYNLFTGWSIYLKLRRIE